MTRGKGPRRPAAEVPAFSVADWPERECKYCHRPFKPATLRQVRCSRKCVNPAPAPIAVEPGKRRPGRPPAARELVESLRAHRRTGLTWERIAKLHGLTRPTAFRLAGGARIQPDVPQPRPDRGAR